VIVLGLLEAFAAGLGGSGYQCGGLTRVPRSNPFGRTSSKTMRIRFLAISSGSKYIELAGDEVDHRL
jgi:hypothetical protein